MRILRAIFSYLLIIVVLGGIGFLLLREGMLIWAGAQLENDLTTVQRISAGDTSYVSRCRERGIGTGSNAVKAAQLRFTDAQRYVVEVVCEGFSLSPILVDQGTLPFAVEKAAGNTGFIWEQKTAEIRGATKLVLWGRMRTLTPAVTGLSPKAADAAATAVGPESSCSGYGYSCCNADTQAGTGGQYGAVSDCPQSCYARCERRPVILSFNTDPFMDADTRTVSVTAGQTVTFTWVAEMPTATGAAEIAFGDGTSETLSATAEETQHQYTCGQAQCRYTATITVTDAAGRTSAETPLTQLVVHVQNR